MPARDSARCLPLDLDFLTSPLQLRSSERASSPGPAGAPGVVYGLKIIRYSQPSARVIFSPEALQKIILIHHLQRHDCLYFNSTMLRAGPHVRPALHLSTVIGHCDGKASGVPDAVFRWKHLDAILQFGTKVSTKFFFACGEPSYSLFSTAEAGTTKVIHYSQQISKVIPVRLYDPWGLILRARSAPVSRPQARCGTAMHRLKWP